MNCVVIQHVLFENLGTFAEVLEKKGAALKYYQAGLGLPEAEEFVGADLAVVLGGPIGANDEELYPFVANELALVAARAKEDRPLLGICLGAQYIAKALGARVYPGRAKEIGFGALALTPKGEASPLRLLAGAPVLHWHGDTFDVPKGCDLLASTPLTVNQAFRRGNALALQFHPEADAARLEQWLIGHACELAQASVDVPGLRAAGKKLGEALKTQGQLFFSEWLSSAGL
jgi:GMP synthase (glutamine-hydrolysing)